MKYFFRIFIILFVFTACKTKKTIVDGTASVAPMSAKKVARKHIAAHLDKNTIAAKVKVKFDNGKTKENISVSLKMIKDEVIWLKASKIITLLKAKITPKKVRFYSPYTKEYFDGDFSSLKKILGTDINFKQLQNLLLGQAIKNVKKEKQTIHIVDNSYVLSPKNQITLFDIFFAVNPSHFKLDRQSLVNSIKNQRLDILYTSYKLIENEYFPTNVSIKAKQPTRYTNVDLNYKTVKFNTSLNMPFKVPNNYKRINL